MHFPWALWCGALRILAHMAAPCNHTMHARWQGQVAVCCTSVRGCTVTKRVVCNNSVRIMHMHRLVAPFGKRFQGQSITLTMSRLDLDVLKVFSRPLPFGRTPLLTTTIPMPPPDGAHPRAAGGAR